MVSGPGPGQASGTQPSGQPAQADRQGPVTIFTSLPLMATHGPGPVTADLYSARPQPRNVREWSEEPEPGPGENIPAATATRMVRARDARVGCQSARRGAGDQSVGQQIHMMA